MTRAASIRHAPTLCLLALTGVLALPAAARADHVTPTVSGVGLTLTDKIRECGRNSVGLRQRCGWRGAYNARVEWSTSCTGGATPRVTVRIFEVRPSGAAGPAYDELDDQPATGSGTIRALPGHRLRASVELVCDASASDDSHSSTATGTGPAVLVRPFMDGYELTSSTTCGVRLRGQRAQLTFQARQPATFAYGLRFSQASLIPPGGTLSGRLRRIRLYAKGAGISRRDYPSLALYRQLGSIGTFVRPRRRGRLSLWATIGGVRTNTAKAPVIGISRACARGT